MRGLTVNIRCIDYIDNHLGSQDQANSRAGALIAGILEETIFRGLLFRLSSKILGTWGALILTAALFSAAHAFNRGATVSSSLAIALEAGLLLGAAYAATQRLWVPIGLHIGWNFTELTLDSGSGISYANVVGSYLYLNRLDEAKATAQEAQARTLDNPFLHIYLHLVAFLQHDTPAMERE